MSTILTISTMTSKPHSRISRWLFRAVSLLLLPALATHAQYVGKVAEKTKPTLRATALYEYTGSMTKPNASRLVPIVVWDGARYQPGGLYLAQPEPLAVAPGTQYVLEPGGVPAGLFNVAFAGRLGNAESQYWVGVGRFQAEAPAPAPKKLVASKQLPVLSGGSGKAAGSDPQSDASGPVLHRKATTDSTSSSSQTSDPNQPTLHRRDADTPASGGSSTGSGSDSSAPPPDPDRPTLHKKDTGSGASDPALGSQADPDRPTLHHHASAESTTTAPDPDRPHLRYGQADDGMRVLPVELKETPTVDPATGVRSNAVPIGQVVAISDTQADEAHPYSYTWPAPDTQAAAQAAMHSLALRALSSAVQATFGPAAKNDAALLKAAAAGQATFGPGAKSTAATHKRTAAAPPNSVDPLLEPRFEAFELSYGGGATYIYTAHTAGAERDQRFVTVIAQPDFYGRPQVVFSQTTRGDMLAQTPALRLVDAADVNGDHRAELLFEQQVAVSSAPAPAGRQFAIYSVVGGAATEVYTSWNPAQ